MNRVYFKKGSQKSQKKNINPLLTTASPTTDLLPELPFIVQTRSPCRIISIKRMMEERNTIYGNSNIVMAAVKQDGDALEFASEDIQNDREIVMDAVEQNGIALEFASEYLKKDRKIAMAAVKKVG